MRFLIILLLLASCDMCDFKGNWRNDRKVQAEVLDKCLTRAAEARKGSNYSTEDDEDYDEVIYECGRQADIISNYCPYEKTNNPAPLKE